MEEIFLAGGCLWGVQEFMTYIPGVITTEAGRVNGTSKSTQSKYDGYAESVRIEFDPAITSVIVLIEHLFEIINPYSINQQGQDVGKKYRTGIYSSKTKHLVIAQNYLKSREDFAKLTIEVMPMINFVPSDKKHQQRLYYYPEDHFLCHIPWTVLHKYKR